jgi:two-component system phosphate regulon sensor histidine kinase PhoR
MNPRASLVRFVLLPSLIVAAAFLASWTYRTTARLEGLDKNSVIDSTVLLTQEKVDRVERLIIADDNAAVAVVNPDDLDTLVSRWLEAADRISPTIRSVMVLDEAQRVLRHVSRGGETQASHFRQLFAARILPQLRLDEEASPSHKHLHDTFDGENVLITYLTRDVGGRRYFVILEVDLDYVRNYVLRGLFDSPTARASFNVVDEDGHLVLGKPLTGPAEWVVSRRFPTTLYKWRVSVAARSAPELEARARRRRLLDAVLVAFSLAVLIAGVAFLTYAARNEQRLNRLKSEFIATVSHELKTPLSLIRMFGEMLSTERVSSDAKRRQYLEIIVRESERLTGLIENVLDFAKLERGKPAYEFKRANLGDVITRGVDMFRVRLDRERPRIVADVAGTIPDADLDERALQLLLFNLLDNAVKYAGESETITVRVRADGRTLRLEVQDEGPGIDEDDRKRVFERFYRGKRAGNGGARGSGIGLALVKSIAQAHGGDAEARNAAERGAIFVVTLPVRTATPDERDATWSEASDASTSTSTSTAK